jgi:hypothetical protein
MMMMMVLKGQLYVLGRRVPSVWTKLLVLLTLSPVIKYIFKFSLLKKTFPSIWKELAVLPVIKKRNRAVVTNCRPILIINYSSKVFGTVIHDQLSFHFNYHTGDFLVYILYVY